MALPTLIVMAAGIGSRYGGLKQIDPVGPGGEIVLDYAVYDAIRAGFGQVVFIIRRDIEQAFKEKIGKNVEKRIETRYVYQELDFLPAGFQVPANREKPWGTAHAVLSCQGAVKGPFGVINADDFYGPSAFKALGDFLRDAEDIGGVYHFCLLGYVLKNTLSDHGHVARGVCRADARNRLIEIHERLKIQKFGDQVKYEENGAWTEVPADSTVSMNMWGLTPGLFKELEHLFPGFLKENINNPKAEFLLPVQIGGLINAKKAQVSVLPTAEKWFGITYREDKPVVEQAVRRLVSEGVYPERLWS